MRLATCVLWVAVVGMVVCPRAASAQDAGPASYRAVIDRVDVEPSALGGTRMRVALSALALQGQILDLTDPKSIKTMVGASKLDAPYALGRYGQTNADTAIVIVLQANLAYADTLPSIVATLDEIVLSKLNDRTQVAVLSYGDSTGSSKLGPLKTGRSRLGEVAPDGSASEPALLDTIDRALRLLKRAKTTPEGRPLRKLIIVIGDGRDRSGDRERVTQIGRRADREGVRIHALGYAPSNVRRPLLTLGELAKRSLGTFRWVRDGGAGSWSGGFTQLRDEILNQYVLTYFLPSDAELGGRKLKIVTVGRTEATSNDVRIPDARCGSEACPTGYCANATCVVPRLEEPRGVLGWTLLIVGIVVGVLVILGLIGFLLQRRQQAQVGPPLAPGQLPVPGSVPPPPGSKPPKQKRSKPPKNQPIAPPPPPAVGPALLVISGPRTGERIPLQHGFTIGKAPGSNLLLDDGYTSTNHAQIGVEPGGTCRLYDRNSTNGTFANGVRVTEVVLGHGMSIRIGSTELRFLAE
jgi:hypothetical protein